MKTQNEQIRITPRETQVADLIAYGHIEKEVAVILGISKETVSTLKKRVYAKTGCRNTADLTRWYLGRLFKVNFDLNPLQRAAIAFSFLMLTVAAELVGSDILRPRNRAKTRTAKVIQGRKSRSRKTDYYLLTA